MSRPGQKGGTLSDDEYEYVVRHFAQDERALLRRMAERALRAGMPMIMISEDQARFLGLLVRMSEARRSLDVGTLFGYSAAILARAMPKDGRVLSLELEPRNARIARENLEAEGLGAKVEVVEGRALETLGRLRSGRYDFMFVDAEKTGYVDYLEEAARLLRPGGILAADNTLAFGKIAAEPLVGDPDRASVEAIRRFNAALAGDERFDPCLVSIGDGLALGVRRPTLIRPAGERPRAASPKPARAWARPPGSAGRPP